jgi:hypothetical protein
MLNAVDFNHFMYEENGKTVGRPRHLKFDINAIADVERETKAGFMTIMGQDRIGFDTVRIMIWAGLKHEDPSLTVFKVGEHLQKYITTNKTNMMIAISTFSDAILEALKLSGLIDDGEGDRGNETAGAEKE